MLTRYKIVAIATIVLILGVACSPGEPTATHAPPTATPTAIVPANTPAPPTPVATSSPSPTPTPLLSLEKSPQEFDARGTFQVGLGDLDGDGDLDAVFANPQRHNSEVWLNDGRGTFTDTGQRLTQYGHGVGVADFDDDGDLDAFINCHYFVSPSKLYLNDGNAAFQDSGQDLGDAQISAAELNLVDLNGDGNMDVHVMYYDPNGLPDKVYLNDGTGTFSDSGLALDEETIAWGDLDGDGDVDYFGKRWGEGYVVQLNDGDGQLTTGWQMDDSQSTLGGVALADLDGDGDLDALLANGFRTQGSYPSRLLWNDGSGQFTDSGQLLNETLAAELGEGDLDGDGDLDVFVSNMDLPNQVWFNDGQGHLFDSGLQLGTSTDASTKPSLGDLDGDGDLDVFVGSLMGRPEVWFNTTATRDSEGLIAFVSTRDGNGEVYVMDAAGVEGSSRKPQRLTNSRDWDYFPTWSPDGTRIAFYTHLTDKEWAIQVMDADGGNLQQLTDNRSCDGAPYWSPDGTRIAFTSAPDCDPDNREIVVMNADGSNQQMLTNNDADDYLSAWSPDSTQIAFVSNRDGNDEIYIMDADGGNPRRLTDSPGQDHMPCWSPDGTQIAFVSDRDGDDEVYVMDVSGNNVQQLTHHPGMDWFPFWSPDGKHIVFNSRRDGNLEIYVMDADGSNVQRLTNNPADDFGAVWQPRPEGDQVDTWVRTYEGEPRWVALDALQTGDGGYLLVGSTHYSHQNTRQEDVYLVKTDATGEIVWAQSYGGDNFDRGNAAIQVDDGGFVILGETQSSGAGDWDMVLIKADADGNELWSKTFGGPAQERANAIRRTADGGYVLVGSTKSFGAAGGDLYLIKTDDQGNEVWSHTYGGEYDEEGYDVHQTPDGGFLILAQVLHVEGEYTDQNPDIFLLRTDAAGEKIWSQVWEKQNVEGGHALLPTSDGSYVITGITGAAGSQTGLDFLFLKLDADGHQVWDKSMGDESAVDYGTDVIETPDGGYLLTGLFNRSGYGAIPLIKTDADGETVWSRNLIEGRGNKVAMKVLPALGGGYLIVGITDEHRRAFETVLIKTDSEGNVSE